MRTPLLSGLLVLLAACDPAREVRLQVVNDSQEKQVDITVRCDGKLVLDTLVAKYKSADDRLRRRLYLRPGLHRIVAESRQQRTRLDTTISTAETNVLGITFRYDSLGPRTQKTYFADGAAGEITFPAFYVRRSFRLFQFQTRGRLQP
ncbi:hypothetical protein [Hymenobacter chitinivorans]|uniref:Lipoprotein n=1 Tax=Hymenobacter chitinivorans DSM 11115 TaxID=1121954 RepID=A0A2M9BLP5_9BACT|nr:hypothetical protein [Hymenobacter chitinivorans]PJJ58869.1 hypothetical protein CLV45_0280 [Hymenobacter chitinivorans DSM 11115]